VRTLWRHFPPVSASLWEYVRFQREKNLSLAEGGTGFKKLGNHVCCRLYLMCVLWCVCVYLWAQNKDWKEIHQN
jgi:hypothetical protein